MTEPIYSCQQEVCARLGLSPRTLERRLAEFPFPRELGKPNGRWSATESALLLWHGWVLLQLSMPLHARESFSAWVARSRPEQSWRLRPPEAPGLADIVGRDVSSRQIPAKDPPITRQRPANRRQGG